MPRAVLSKFPHRHSFYEILYVKEGKGTHVIDFEPYQIQPLSLYFISPGQVHFWQQEKLINGRIILFTGDFLYLTPPNRSVLSELEFFHSLERHPHLLIKKDQIPVILQLLKNLEIEYQSTGTGKASVLRAYLHILLIYIQRFYEEVHRHNVSINASALARRFKRLVSENCIGLRSVETYAVRIGVSAGHLRDTVKAATGMTPGRIIRQTVALEAKRLLIHTDLTVAEIAYSLSFEDPSYFGRFFKRETSLSPRLFREQIRKRYQFQYPLLPEG
jgi:AraC-like DNA-binding protein